MTRTVMMASGHATTASTSTVPAAVTGSDCSAALGAASAGGGGSGGGGAGGAGAGVAAAAGEHGLGAKAHDSDYANSSFIDLLCMDLECEGWLGDVTPMHSPGRLRPPVPPTVGDGVDAPPARDDIVVPLVAADDEQVSGSLSVDRGEGSSSAMLTSGDAFAVEFSSRAASAEVSTSQAAVTDPPAAPATVTWSTQNAAIVSSVDAAYATPVAPATAASATVTPATVTPLTTEATAPVVMDSGTLPGMVMPATTALVAPASGHKSPPTSLSGGAFIPSSPSAAPLKGADAGATASPPATAATASAFFAASLSAPAATPAPALAPTPEAFPTQAPATTSTAATAQSPPSIMASAGDYNKPYSSGEMRLLLVP